MGERNTGLRSVLVRPRVYEAFQQAVGRRKQQRAFVEHHVQPAPGDRVLDIGCGPGDLLNALPDVDYIGFDLNEQYIVSARARFGARATFFVGDVADVDISSLGQFDCIMANGVLHHLNDAAANRLLQIAATALNANGRLATIDPCFSTSQTLRSRFVVSRDRGENVRTVASYQALAHAWFADVQAAEYHDLLRIPYTHCALTCSHALASSRSSR